MRIFNDIDLIGCSKRALEIKLDMVKASDELTRAEKDANIEKLEFFINGGIRFKREDVLEDIKQGQADISDLTYR